MGTGSFCAQHPKGHQAKGACPLFQETAKTQPGYCTIHFANAQPRQVTSPKVARLMNNAIRHHPRSTPSATPSQFGGVRPGVAGYNERSALQDRSPLTLHLRLLHGGSNRF